MMPGYGGGGMGWGWMLMSAGTLVFIVLIAGVVWLLVRSTGTGAGGSPTAAPGDSAREILTQRYARGEIDDAEYQQRLRTLTG
jgi:putative membrane protein